MGFLLWLGLLAVVWGVANFVAQALFPKLYAYDRTLYRLLVWGFAGVVALALAGVGLALDGGVRRF